MRRRTLVRTMPPPSDKVDLGLPSGVKWSSCNIGARNPEDYGLYFQWGDPQGYPAEDRIFTKDQYIHVNPTTTAVLKYNSIDKLNHMEDSDDAAQVLWGNGWRIPSAKECQELIDNTTSTWTEINGVKGALITSKINGNTLFFPASGYAANYKANSTGSIVQIWSSDLAEGQYYIADSLYATTSVSLYLDTTKCWRENGRPIRPVI